MKNKTHAHTHTHTHIQSHEHSYANTHKHTHIHKCTQRHTLARERALACTHTHTKCSFVVGGQSLWNHLPDNVKEAGSIELFQLILKTVVFSQSFEIPAFFNFVTVPLTLVDLFVVKYDAKYPTAPHNTPVSTCIQCMKCSEK